MKQYSLLILAFVSLVAAACSDFLEEKSQDEVIPKTATDFREILLGYQDRSACTPAHHVLDDDVAIDESQFWEDEDDYSAQRIEGQFTWQPDMWERPDNGVYDRYGDIYTSISAMNVVVEKIDDADGSTEEKDIVKAQALGGRAYYYFILVNTFGAPYNYDKDALGVVLKLESPFVGKGMERATVGEVYAQIVEDLETASSLLNKYPKQRGDFLMNSTAADILLSRVYLYMEEWDKAAEAAGRAIESAEGLWDYTHQPEGEFFYITTYDNPEVEWLFGNDRKPVSILMASTELASLYDANDRRMNLLPGIRKIETENFGPNVMVRSAEAYLNRAEARVLSLTPDLAGALADLNELRRHRIVGYTDVSITDAEELLQAIRDERRKELCFEAHRWFDLRRYGMPSISHDFRIGTSHPMLRYTLEEKDPLYTLPIPRSVLDSNVELEQNPLTDLRGGVPIN